MTTLETIREIDEGIDLIIKEYSEIREIRGNFYRSKRLKKIISLIEEDLCDYEEELSAQHGELKFKKDKLIKECEHNFEYGYSTPYDSYDICSLCGKER
jgi:hypothetical protein